MVGLTQRQKKKGVRSRKNEEIDTRTPEAVRARV